MKFDVYEIPDDLLYTKEHEWVRIAGETATIGITDYAAKTLNDVVYVTSPKVGQQLAQFKSMGSVESIKAVSELYSPVSGQVVEVNAALTSRPELVNTSPYDDGWILRAKLADQAQVRNLLGPSAYSAHLESLSKQHG
jgi:glycine cleavage system H protein